MNGLEGMGLKMALAQRWAEYAEALERALNTICIPADVYMQDAGAVALAEEAVAWARQLLVRPGAADACFQQAQLVMERRLHQRLQLALARRDQFQFSHVSP